MKLKQISVFIENAPGRLYEVTNALGEAGINLRALTLVDTGDFGKLRLLVSDVATTRRIMMEHHIPARVDDVVAAEIPDHPGARRSSESRRSRAVSFSHSPRRKDIPWALPLLQPP